MVGVLLVIRMVLYGEQCGIMWYVVWYELDGINWLWLNMELVLSVNGMLWIWMDMVIGYSW